MAKERELISEYNKGKPDFYSVVVKTTQPDSFPNDKAKLYYANLIKSALAPGGMYVTAYSYTPEEAYFIVQDDTKSRPDIESYIRSVTGKYERYTGISMAGVEILIKKVKSKRTKDERQIIGAKNARAPRFYAIALEGKDSITAFPGKKAKSYYINCIRLLRTDIPVDILAYSVINNAAYFVVATWDQTPVSIKKYFAAANAGYSQFYNEQYLQIGNAFKNKCKLKRIAAQGDIIPAIVMVHSQPAYAGLCGGFDDYSFTSYTETPGSGIASLDILRQYFGEDYLVSEYTSGHICAPQTISANAYFGAPEKEKFRYDLEIVMANHNCYNREILTTPELCEIIIDMNEMGYTFDYIIEEILVRDKLKYDLLIPVAGEIALRFKSTYDEITKKLDVYIYGEMLIMDIIMYINAKKGYAYDYIMNMLGLAYPNAEFLVRLIQFEAKEFGLNHVSILRKLGIYENDLLESIKGRLTI